jgi:hypothetical protein
MTAAELTVSACIKIGLVSGGDSFAFRWTLFHRCRTVKQDVCHRNS